ncbi:ERF family protein [Paenibacillus sp. TRM 82003]|nr:ERF family protein [Paenibacillus sp. TRM 82003]
MTEQPKMNLYQKISAVMQDVEYLSKDDDISFGNTKYKAISEEKVTQTVRASLIKNGLVIIPVEQEHSREGTLSTVNVKYKIVDIETGQYEIAVSSGTGADTQDKGVGKAMTYSYKYLLLRTFAIPTGEDPDKVSSAELDEESRKRSTPPQTTRTASQASRQANTPPPPQNAPQTTTGGGNGVNPAAVAARVYKLREELGWEWSNLNQFASDTLGREIKYLKSGVKTAEEWKQIEDAMLELRQAAMAG